MIGRDTSIVGAWRTNADRGSYYEENRGTSTGW